MHDNKCGHIDLYNLDSYEPSSMEPSGYICRPIWGSLGICWLLYWHALEGISVHNRIMALDSSLWSLSSLLPSKAHFKSIRREQISCTFDHFSSTDLFDQYSDPIANLFIRVRKQTYINMTFFCLNCCSHVYAFSPLLGRGHLD